MKALSLAIPFRRSSLVLAGSIAALLACPSARAADGSYTGAAGDGNFANGANWSTDAAPGATVGVTSPDIATFSSHPVATVITLDEGRNVKSITFDSDTVGSFTIGGAGANAGPALVLSPSGTIQMNGNVFTGTETFNAPISLNGNYTISNLSTGSARFVFAGDITGRGGSLLSIQTATSTGVNLFSGSIKDGQGILSIAIGQFSSGSGSGSVEFTGANTYSGNTQIDFLQGQPLGVGILTTSGTNTSNGTTTLQHGTLNLNNADNGGIARGTLFLQVGYLEAQTAAAGILSNVVRVDNTVTIAGSNSITFNGDVTLTQDSRGIASSITGGGFLTLNGAKLNLGTATGSGFTFNFTGTGNTTVNSVIQDYSGGMGTAGGSVSFGNSGTTTLNAANTYTGSTTISAGTVNFGANGTLGAITNALTISGGTLDLTNANQRAGAVTISGGTIQGGTLTGTSYAVSGGTVTGVLAGANAVLTKTGTGTTTLSGANTYGGGTVISAGTVVAQNSAVSNTLNVLGTGTITLNGGGLTLKANPTADAQNVTVGDGGADSNVVVTGNSTITFDRFATTVGQNYVFNNLTIGNAALTVAQGSGSANTSTGQFTGTTTLTGDAIFSSTGTGTGLYITGPIVDNGSGFGVTKTATSGTQFLYLGGANTYTGATNVNGGVLSLGYAASGPIAGSAGGTVNNSVSVAVSNAALLILENTIANADRIGDTRGVTLGTAGELRLNANGAVNTTEKIGTLALGPGNGIITLSSAAGRITTLEAGTFDRGTKLGTLLIRGSSFDQSAGTNVGRVVLDDGGASLTQIGTGSVLKIVPYMMGDNSQTGNGSNFVTYDSTKGLRALVAADYTTLAAGSTTAPDPVNAKAFNGIVSTTSDLTVNSLLFTGTTALNGSGGALIINSGALALGTSNVASVGNGFNKISFGNNEGVISVFGNTFTINTPISVSGGGGITKTGPGTLTIGSAANTYTGPTTVNAGTFNFATGINNALNGTTGTPLQVNGGTFTVLATTQTVTSLGLAGSGTVTGTSGSGVLNLGGNVSYDATGNNATGGTISGLALNLNGSRTFTIADSSNTSADLTVTSIVANGTAAAAGLTKAGAGTLVLSAIETYTGPTTISSGTLRLAVTSTNNIASSPSIFIGDGATLDASGLTNNTLILASGQSITGTGATGAINTGLDKGLTLTGNNTLAGSTSSLAITRLNVVDTNGTTNTITGGNFTLGVDGLSRGLVIGNTALGTLTISGGTVTSVGGSSIDLVGNVGFGGTLIINGGNYVNAGTLSLSGTGTTSDTFTLSSGSATIGTLGLGSSGSTTVNLTGGTMTLANLNTSGGTRTLNLDGGVLRASASTLAITGLTTINVKNGGAIIDTNGFNVTAASSFTNFAGATTDSFTKRGAGTLTLSSAGNNYTGATTVTGGTLLVSGSISGSTSLVVNNGATLQLGSTNNVKATAAVNLGGGAGATSGGTLKISDNLGANTAVATETFGPLTLSLDSTIDFGTSAAGRGVKLFFASFTTHTPGTGPDLAITNWNASSVSVAGGVADDRLVFTTGTAADFRAAFAQSDISFNGSVGYDVIDLPGGGYEVVPEPSAGALALVTVAFGAFGRRRRNSRS